MRIFVEKDYIKPISEISLRRWTVQVEHHFHKRVNLSDPNPRSFNLSATYNPTIQNISGNYKLTLT